MARADLLLSLVKAGAKGDRALFNKTVEAIIAEERSKQHNVLAERLTEQLQAGGPAQHGGPSALSNGTLQLLHEVVPRRMLSDLILPAHAREVCEEMVEEHHRRELLNSYGLEPRHRVLLAGPPGNGKTSLAEAIAESLMVPLFVVRYEGIIGSYLGETSGRLRKVFDLVRTHMCVLFFDEFDTIGKERGDAHETGEIKRVVSSLLLQMDALPSHVIVVVASNHPELLDRAVWRRFQIRLSLPPPEPEQIAEWFTRFEERVGVRTGYSPGDLARELSGLSYAEVEEFGADIYRRFILAQPNKSLRQIVASRLKHWKHRFSPSDSQEQ